MSCSSEAAAATAGDPDVSKLLLFFVGEWWLRLLPEVDGLEAAAAAAAEYGRYCLSEAESGFPKNGFLSEKKKPKLLQFRIF